MPICIPKELPAFQTLANENIFVMISCTCNRDSLPLPAGGLYGFFIVPFISEFHYIHY